MQNKQNLNVMLAGCPTSLHSSCLSVLPFPARMRAACIGAGPHMTPRSFARSSLVPESDMIMQTVLPEIPPLLLLLLLLPPALLSPSVRRPVLSCPSISALDMCFDRCASHVQVREREIGRPPWGKPRSLWDTRAKE